MSKVYLVSMTVMIDGEQKVLRSYVRAKSPQAARKEVIAASIAVRRATVDDFVPQTADPAPMIEESDHE